MAARKRNDEKEGILNRIREQLRAQGIDLDLLSTTEVSGCEGIKVVCIGASLRDSVDELGKRARDQVVMVRIDAETSLALDRWVETGAVKSRSEAAALFIREGLKVREAELDRLADSLQEVERARERLKKEVRDLFGDKPEEDP